MGRTREEMPRDQTANPKEKKQMSEYLKWPLRFLELAKTVAQWSKDTTKVGAIATDPGSRAILETGYNGIPRGVADLPARRERPAKYLWTAHAEENLVAHAARAKLQNADVTVTHLCCSKCARMLINAGVARVFVGDGQTSMPPEEFEVSRTMLREAGVDLIFVCEGLNDDIPL
jgi:dCMP deaminase